MHHYFHIDPKTGDPKLTDEQADALAAHAGKCVALMRAKAGMTQDQVSERMGVGKELVSRIERGVVPLSLRRMVEFARLFSCSPMDFLPPVPQAGDAQSPIFEQALSGLSAIDKELVLQLCERLMNSGAS